MPYWSAEVKEVRSMTLVLSWLTWESGPAFASTAMGCPILEVDGPRDGVVLAVGRLS